MSQKPERHEFQAEVKQLLDIVIHSLYSNKDIFLRELISNASDALDKLHFEALTDSELLPHDDLQIRIDRDTAVRTISVSDNGIGMTRDEVEKNIGTIAQSGTAEFLRAARETKGQLTPDLIGQFGVGFYASFMVADRVTLVTRRAGTDTATKWESAGEGWYTITDAERDAPGTTVTLHLKPVDGEHGIKDYTDEWVIKEIVKRYSDFVSYPIRMRATPEATARDAEGKVAESAPPEDLTLNSMKAIWSRSKGEVTEQEYNDFYKHIAHDWRDPLTHISSKMEGALDARALLYIPAHAPLDLYHHEMSYRGLQLYVKRVFIMDECRDLMPTYLRFVKGVVDAEDISLNVSRELLQQDRQITAIRKFLVRKVMDALRTMQKDEPDKYRDFWASFGPVLKEGLLEWVDKREAIFDLVMAASSNDATHPTTLADYVGRMKSGQEHIYYLTGPSREVVERSPHLEAFLDRGYEVLFFVDPVDEIWLAQAPEYQDHPWKSVGKGDVELGTSDDQERDRETLKEQAEVHRDLLAALREHLKDDVKDVRLSHRLTSSVACLVGEIHDLSPQMIEHLRRAGQDVPSIKRTLELNPSHPIVEKLRKRYADNADDEMIAEYARLLLNQAVLAEGGQLADPAGFSKQVADLMAKSL